MSQARHIVLGLAIDSTGGMKAHRPRIDSAPPPGSPVPAVLVPWLQPFREFFSAPVWDRVLVLVAGAMLTPGKRTVSVDTDERDPRKQLVIDEHMDVYPRTYTVQYYGYRPNQVAISFDDGPDPKWTPKILDILTRLRKASGSCSALRAKVMR